MDEYKSVDMFFLKKKMHLKKKLKKVKDFMA